MNNQQIEIRLGTEEQERMEDQQIEFEALNQVNDHIENIENSILWKTKPLKIIQRITQFITTMKHFSASYRFKIMHKSIFQLINDKSSSFSYYLNQNQLYQIPSLFQSIKYQADQANPFWWRIYLFIQNDKTVFLPADSFLFFWDTILMFVTFINIFYVPLQLSFQFDESEIGTPYILFSIIPSCVFVIDLILCFFKAYYEKGILRTKKSEIFWHYIQNDFTVDLMVILPFFLSFFGYGYANHLMMIRITRVRRTMTTIEDIANFKEKSAIIYQLFCLIYSMLLISHLCACFFHYLAIYQMENGCLNTWLHAQNIVDAEDYVKYFHSLYWITITSMTVGYGDIVPITLTEKIVTTIITFFVTGVFGYALGMIQSIFYKMAEQQQVNNSKLRLVSNHIKARGLNPQLQFRVRKYIEYYLQFKQDEELDLDELMGQLNPKLKKEVQIAMYFKYLKQSKFFGSNFSDSVLRSLCFKIHEKTFAPEEVLFKTEVIPDQFYIILNGRVKSMLLHKTVKKYKAGSFLGEKEFCLQKQFSYDIIASTFVQVAYLNYNDFLEILKTQKNAYEIFRFVVDNNLFGEVTQQIICEACQSHHYFHNCPMIFFQQNKQKVIREFNQSYEQERSQFKRKKKQKFQKIDIQDRALDWLKKSKQQLGIQLNQTTLGLYGFLENQKDNESEINSKFQNSFYDLNALPIQRLQRRNTTLIYDKDIQEIAFMQDDCIDRVKEYEIYYPYFNITKICKLLNKQNVYKRIYDQIRNHRNKFATFIAQRLIYNGL